MPDEKVGIEETKDLVKMGAAFGEAIYEAGKDSKWTLGDYKHFLPVLGEIIPAISGIEKVPAELKDLDEAEREELCEYFAKEFDIPDDLIEEFVENNLAIAQRIFVGVALWKKIRERE